MSSHRLSVGSSGSPTTRAHVDHSLSWTDDLPVCHLSGVGFSTNQIYREDGFRCEEHEFEDRSIHFNVEGNISLYGVFDGHDGSRVSHFAAQRMPAELLLGQLSGKTDDEQIKEILLQAFISVEKGFTDSIDDLLAQKANLMLHVPEGIMSYELYNKYPELFKRLEQVETAIAGGTTAVIALIKDAKLYIANVGCSRALLCTTDQDGILRVVQLSVDHHIHNQDEVARLTALGADPEALKSTGTVTPNSIYTRTIGDHDIKTRVRELAHFRDVTSEPVIAEPYVAGGIPLDEVRGFLVLMSYGLYKSLEDATDTEKVNCDIASMVASEFCVQSTLNGVAQAVVDRVVRLHHDTFMAGSSPQKQRCQTRKDITLLVRNIRYPLPNAIGNPASGGPQQQGISTAAGVGSGQVDEQGSPSIYASHGHQAHQPSVSTPAGAGDSAISPSLLPAGARPVPPGTRPGGQPSPPAPANLNEPLSVIIPPSRSPPPPPPGSLILCLPQSPASSATNLAGSRDDVSSSSSSSNSNERKNSRGSDGLNNNNNTTGSGTITNSAAVRKPDVSTTIIPTSTTGGLSISSTQSTNDDSTQSSDADLGQAPFGVRPQGPASGLPLDSEGRIAAYVDFSDFYKLIEEMTEAQLESFNNTSEPKPAYEPIPEEPGSPYPDQQTSPQVTV